MNKKKWATPKLIVLVRGKPEELVLTNCKSGFNGDTPISSKEACASYASQESACAECSSIIGT